jgi:hypothetical protein
MVRELAIKGHETRGKEVVEILEMLGANNKRNYTGAYPDTLYILNDKDIDIGYACDNREVFTLQEFLEKFPFKIDDIVISDNYYGDGIIREMFWDKTAWSVKYCVEWPNVITWAKHNEIKFLNTSRKDYKDPLRELRENICENKISMLMIDSNVCSDEVELILNDFEIEIRDGKTYAVKKKPKYPKTYEECCGILGITFDYPDIRMVSTDEFSLYSNFIQLIRCRDAYWKIAGEQIGLGKSWEQDYNDRCFIIANNNGNIHTYEYHGNNNVILAFPTEEMRDAFFENFTDLIENCKQLL